MDLYVFLVAMLLLAPPAMMDDYGRTVSLSSEPQRIISIAPSVTEMVFAIGAEKRLVGVDSESDFPPEARRIQKVGSYISPSLERIIALDPDLLLVSDLTPPQVVNAVEGRGIKVFVVAPKSVKDIAVSMRKLGAVLGVEASADAAADEFERRVSVVEINAREQKAKPKVYMEYYPYWTFGPGSFGDDLIELAGGMNIGKKLKSQYAEVSNEFVVSENPDVIVVTRGKHSSTTIDSIKARPGWSSTNAVKNGCIYYIDDNTVSRPGPRTVDALEELYSILH